MQLKCTQWHSFQKFYVNLRITDKSSTFEGKKKKRGWCSLMYFTETNFQDKAPYPTRRQVQTQNCTKSLI